MKQFERTYIVTWRNPGCDAVRVDRQLHTPHYNTSFDSVRKLISVKTGIDVDDIEIVSATLLSSKEIEGI